jgi:hypothetical protein
VSRIKLFWFGAVFLVLGVSGLAMSLCGGWFILNGLGEWNASAIGWGLFIGVLPGAASLYGAREAYRWVMAELPKRKSEL